MDPGDVSRTPRSRSPASSNNPSILIDLSSKHDDSRNALNRRSESGERLSQRTGSSKSGPHEHRLNQRSRTEKSGGRSASRTESTASRNSRRKRSPGLLNPEDARTDRVTYGNKSKDVDDQMKTSSGSASSMDTWERWSPSQDSSVALDDPDTPGSRSKSRGGSQHPPQGEPAWTWGGIDESRIAERSGSRSNTSKSGKHVANRSGGSGTRRSYSPTGRSALI